MFVRNSKKIVGDLMKKTVASIEEELLAEEKDFRDNLKELESLEKSDVVQEYIKRMNQYEIIERRINRLKRECHLAQMEECNHLFVMVPTEDDDKLLDEEVGLYCLQCGITNTRSIDCDVDYDAMIKLLHTTLHYGKILYDKEIKDLDFARRAFKEALNDDMSNKELITFLSEKIDSHEKELKYKHNKSL